MEASAVRFFKRNFLKSSEIDLAAAVFDVETRRLHDHSGQEIALRFRSREVLAVLDAPTRRHRWPQRAGGGRLGCEGRLRLQHRALHRRHTPGPLGQGQADRRDRASSGLPAGHAAPDKRHLSADRREPAHPRACRQVPRPMLGLPPSRSSGLTIWASPVWRHPVCRTCWEKRSSPNWRDILR